MSATHGRLRNAIEDPFVGLLALPLVVAVSRADTTAPSLGLANPLPGEMVSGDSVQILGWAMDASGVTTISYLLDGAPLAVVNRDDHWAWAEVCSSVQIADPNCPNVGYTAVFDSVQISDGNHTLTVTATDPFGNTSSYDRSIGIENQVLDTTAPSMGLANPLSGEMVSGDSVQILGWAMDASGVTTISYLLDGAPLTVVNRDDHWAWASVCSSVQIADPNCPNVGYSAFFDSTQISDGNHTLTVIATDPFGNNSSVNRAFSVENQVVDTTVPSIGLANPLSGEMVSGGSVQILGWAMDASGVTTISYLLDGAPLAVANRDDHWAWASVCSSVQIADPNCPNVGYTAFFDSTQVSDGNHTLTVTATDPFGNSSSANRSFSVANQVVDDATFVSWAIPTSAQPGSNVQFSVTMRNTGTTTWTVADYRLRLTKVATRTAWGISEWAPATDVPPNGTTTFTMTAVAPEAGDYEFRWRMRKVGSSLFGTGSPTSVLTVADQFLPPTLSSASLDRLPAGQSTTIRVQGGNLTESEFEVMPVDELFLQSLPVSVIAVAGDGSWADVEIDATSVSDTIWFVLGAANPAHVAQNPDAEDWKHDAALGFRVVASSPHVDSVFNELVLDDARLIMIVGENLDGYSLVPPSGSIVEDFSNNGTELVARLLSSRPGGPAPPQPALLTLSPEDRGAKDFVIDVAEVSAGTAFSVPPGGFNGFGFCFSLTITKRLAGFQKYWLDLLDLSGDRVDPAVIRALTAGGTLQLDTRLIRISGKLDLRVQFLVCPGGGPGGPGGFFGGGPEQRLDLFCLEGYLEYVVPQIGGQRVEYTFCGADKATNNVPSIRSIDSVGWTTDNDCVSVADVNPGSRSGLRRTMFTKQGCCTEPVTPTVNAVLEIDGQPYSEFLSVTGKIIPEEPDCPTSSGDSVRVEMRAFLPPNWVAIPPPFFCATEANPLHPRSVINSGDGREFNPNPPPKNVIGAPKSSRLEQVIGLIPDSGDSASGEEVGSHEFSAGRSDLFERTSTVGEGKGKVDAADYDGVLDDCVKWHATKTLANESITLRKTVERTSPGSVLARLGLTGSNPTVPFSPPIDFEYDLTITVAGASGGFTFDLFVRHDCMPAHEVYLNDVQIYGFVPQNYSLAEFGRCLTGASGEVVVACSGTFPSAQPGFITTTCPR